MQRRHLLDRSRIRLEPRRHRRHLVGKAKEHEVEQDARGDDGKAHLSDDTHRGIHPTKPGAELGRRSSAGSTHGGARRLAHGADFGSPAAGGGGEKPGSATPPPPGTDKKQRNPTRPPPPPPRDPPPRAPP